jgi:membrane-associated phospholipid phosphatase
LHFTIGFLFAAAFIWSLAGVTQDVLAHDPLVQIDRNVASTLQSWSTPTATRVFQFLSYLGNPAALALSVFICIILDRGGRAIEIVAWMVSITGGLFLQLILIYLLPRIPNFPNGHVMLSMIVYGLVAYFEVLSSANWNDRVRAICSSIILILIIGFSRLYLQLHYLSDILAGFAAGGLWLTFCIIAIELMRRGEIRWPLFDQIKAQFEHF